jgi:hypothetical protein
VWPYPDPAPCPPLHVLMALPGVISGAPTAFVLIDVADLPHWLLWSWVCLGRDPSEEPAWDRWQAAHPEAA